MLNTVKSYRLSIKIGYLLIGSIFTILLFSCNTTGPAAATLAEKIEGNFKGMLQNPGGNTSDYEIIVTEINNTRVSIAPASGSASATFEVDLTSETSGSITSIVLKAPSDILENNGTFVASTGRLSYTYHLGGNDDYNIEIFFGDKQ